jgi:hypothetical protein
MSHREDDQDMQQDEAGAGYASRILSERIGLI